MPRKSCSDLLAFIAVARERSFTRAARQLGVSQSALSHTVRALETRLGVRLLARTTRSVSPTQAGMQLLQTVAPQFDEIEAELAAIAELRDRPAGVVRITASQNATDLVLWPRLQQVLPKYPDIRVELCVENRFVDIVAEHYDFGVRFGDEVARDMVAVPISANVHMTIVASPVYLRKRPAPLKPADLSEHACINLYLQTSRQIYPWSLKKGRKQVGVKMEGQLAFSDPRQILQAALAGFGLGYVPEALAQPLVRQGKLVQVLQDWSRTFPGYHLYCSTRGHVSQAMEVLMEELRFRPGGKDRKARCSTPGEASSKHSSIKRSS